MPTTMPVKGVLTPYRETNWISSDIITADKMNNLEIQVYNLTDTLISNEYDGLNNAQHIDEAINNLNARINSIVQINSFTIISTNPIEYNTIPINNRVTLFWNLNMAPVSLKIGDVVIDNAGKTGTYNDDSNTTALTTNKTYTLNVNNGVATKTATLNVYKAVYYGVSSNSSISAITGLTKQLKASRRNTFNVTSGAGQYIYYCVPTSYGTCTFTVGGFTGGFETPQTITVNGENYYVYRSSNANLGTRTVVVS